MTGQGGLPAQVKENHYPILYALRIVLAVWVAVSHFSESILFGGFGATTAFGRFGTQTWSSMVVGTPVVIGFFVISGFCIHFPFLNQEKLPVIRYYARRYLRILIPVFVAIWIWRMLGYKQELFSEHSILWESVLWSLFCEEVYYALYPLVRRVRRRHGWIPVFASAMALFVGLAATHRFGVAWPAYDVLSTTLLLFPVWLLGCTLAEKSARIQPLKSAWGIWRWRLFAWGGSSACGLFTSMTGIHIPLDRLLFGILAWLWIEKEIAYGKLHQPNRLLVFGGAWSYSLYLMHVGAPGLYGKLHIPSLGPFLDWYAIMILSLVMAYVFYLIVEKPSHKLARRIRVTPDQAMVTATPEQAAQYT